MEEKKVNKRRVSFAAEHQVNYICHDDLASNKTSSTMQDIPMDLTTDVEEFKNINLFSTAGEEMLQQNIERIFSAGDIQEYEEDPILLKEYSKRRNSLGAKEGTGPSRRNSLNVFDVSRIYSDGDSSFAKDLIFDLGENMEDLKITQNTPENASNNIINDHKACKNDEIIIKSNTMGEEPSECIPKNSKRPSENSIRNESLLCDSSFAVDDLVNTVELKGLINCTKTQAPELNAFLASLGIRFLDESISDGMRRDTLSKSRNTVDPSLFNYFKLSVRERIDYLQGFSAFLAEKMKELQKEIGEAQKSIDIKNINKDLLKKIRNESRNKSKIDWYALRKINEIQFNMKVTENKAKMQEMLSSLNRENLQYDDEIAKASERIERVKGKHAELASLLERYGNSELQEAGKLQQMIDERKHLLEELEKEHQEQQRAFEQREIKENILNRDIRKLIDETNNLRNNIMVKNVDENALQEIQRFIKRYELIFNIKILQLTMNSIKLAINGGNEITLGIDGNMRIESYWLNCRDNDPFYEIAYGELSNKDVKLALQELAARFAVVSGFKREVHLLKSKCKIESIFVNRNLYIRFSCPLTRQGAEVMIDSSLNAFYKNEIAGNLYKDYGKISALIRREILLK
ncbi:hypothetical protein ENBRE01_1429 [Enteropsectra breve]|nr:hypothetical protein ENBRE01_1429 [Enteropsectra breve]